MKYMLCEKVNNYDYYILVYVHTNVWVWHYKKDKPKNCFGYCEKWINKQPKEIVNM